MAQESVVEIADSLFDKKDIAELKTDISKLHNKIIESKYDLLKWIVTAQLAISGLMLAMIKMI